jgi:hypothetical protein
MKMQGVKLHEASETIQVKRIMTLTKNLTERKGKLENADNASGTKLDSEPPKIQSRVARDSP